MKIELLFPFGWGDGNIPHLALPVLLGYLRNKHVGVTARDLDIEIFHYLFSKEYSAFLSERLRNDSARLQAMRSGTTQQRKKAYAFSQEMLKHLPSMYQQALFELKALPLDPKSFYPIRHIPAFEQISGILSTVYSPAKIDILRGGFMSTYTPGSFKHKYSFTLANIFEHISHRDRNFLWDIYTLFLGDEYRRPKNPPEIIGISFAREAQIISGLVLAHLIKEANRNVTIVAGGAMIKYMEPAIRQYPRIFDVVDCFVVGEGEIPLLRFIEAVKGKKSFLNVPQALFRHKNKVVYNQRIEELKPQDFPAPDFSDFPLERYLLPEKVLPYSTSRGCYWNRCAFCTLASSASGYRGISMPRMAEDLKSMGERYKCRNFIFVDECIHPKRVRAISNMLRTKKLRISWSMGARVEKEFSPRMLRDAYRQGCKAISWGIESGSPKVLRLMRKGMSVDTAKSVLGASRSAGIWNHCFIMFSFPGETPKDFKETTNFIIRNSRFIHSIDMGWFVLQPFSYIFQHQEAFGISAHPPPPDYIIPVLAFNYNYARRYNVRPMLLGFLQEAGKLNMCPPVTWDHLLLLLSKSERDKVRLLLGKLRKIEDAYYRVTHSASRVYSNNVCNKG